MNEDLAEAVHWYNRLKQGEDLHLHDLCLFTLQRNVWILIKHVDPYPRPAIYRVLCPLCGIAIELTRDP